MVKRKSVKAVEKVVEKSLQEEERNLVWMCLTCKATAPPNSWGYMNLLKHSCQRLNIWLVDTDTGEQLADNIGQAQQSGADKKEGKEGDKRGERGERAARRKVKRVDEKRVTAVILRYQSWFL